MNNETEKCVSANNAEQNVSLESLFEQLETVLAKMDSDGVTLEESFTLYQEGMDKLKACNEILNGIEKKMILLKEEAAQ